MCTTYNLNIPIACTAICMVVTQFNLNPDSHPENRETASYLLKYGDRSFVIFFGG